MIFKILTDFLLSLANIEYSQQSPCIKSIKFLEQDFPQANLILADGKLILINIESNTEDIFNEINSATGLDIRRPEGIQPEISESPAQTWPNLLDDIGSYINAFHENDSGKRIILLFLENNEENILIILECNGRKNYFTYAHGGYPAALPVSLAQLIKNPDEKPFEPELHRVDSSTSMYTDL